MMSPVTGRAVRRLRRAALCAACALAALPAAARAQDKGAAPAAAPALVGLDQRFAELGITLHFPGEMHVAVSAVPPSGLVRGSWNGKLGTSDLQLLFTLVHRGDAGLAEPSDVIGLVGDALADKSQGGDPDFHFDDVSYLPGHYGYASYAVLARSSKPGATGARAESQAFYLGGLLETQGYVLEIHAKPGLPDVDAAIVRDFLAKGVVCDGKQRDWKWTDAEALQRWKESVPDADKKKFEDPLRTAHYIILTDSSGGKAFAKKMEDCYAAIDKVYPFPEVAERRLMPVFLFRTNDEYYAFFARSFGATVDDARRSAGVSAGDFYSTWYEAPGDPVHVHEATHQIFRNRLGLGGGGSWFQEGVAEYMSTKDNERGAAAHAVKKGKHVPIPDLVKIQSLLFSAPKDNKSGDDAAANQYQEAALIVEFLRQSKFGKDKFQDYIHAVGSVPANDVPAITAAVKRVYGVDLAGLEVQHENYCKTR